MVEEIDEGKSGGVEEESGSYIGEDGEGDDAARSCGCVGAG